MKRIFSLFMLVGALLFAACSDDDPQDVQQDETPMLVVVYPIDGLGDRSYVDNIYRGVEKVALEYGLKVQHLMPYSYEEGTTYIENFMKSDAEEPNRRLYIITEPSFEELVVRLAPQFAESDKRQLLFLETRKEIPNAHTLYLPFYGVNFAAGRLAQQMADVNRVAIFQANDQLAILKEATQGFTEGFEAGEGQSLNTYIMDEGFLGFAMADKLYQEAYRINELFDLVLPLCGGSAQGLFRYNREYPTSSFYTVGIDADMSVYSDRVPFSCVKHMDRIIQRCVEQWMADELPVHQSLGLKEGFTELVLAPKYEQQFAAQLPQVVAEAIEREAAFESKQ
ncbi:MAG: BMP family ABC transporter substrate-binding protein [Bacteroides sp.]